MKSDGDSDAEYSWLLLSGPTLFLSLAAVYGLLVASANSCRPSSASSTFRP